MESLLDFSILQVDLEPVPTVEQAGRFRFPFLLPRFMAAVAQLVRAPDCGSGGCGFEFRRSPL